ncbi:hypothetical protein ABFS83_14G263300 [Erythranthe nasuta]
MAVSVFLLVTVTIAYFMMICKSSEADLISKVCTTARNPSLCNQVLRSDPRSKGSDLAGLGAIIVEKGKDAVKAATNVIKSIPPVGRAKGGVTDTCIELFTDAVDYLNDCKQNLRSRDRDALRRNASGALVGVETCDDGFTEDGGVEPPEAARADRRAEDIIQVLLVIASLSPL